MGFISLYFLAFIVTLFLVYYLVPKKIRWMILLIFSIIFYLLCSWKSIFFILFTTICIYFASNKISKNKTREKIYLAENTSLTIDEKKAYKAKNKKLRKIHMVLGIISIVAVLAVMKYLNFTIGNINTVLGWFNSSFKLSTVKWFLPLGISFYTFQAIGYIADVYWGKYEAEQNFFKFLLFMSFFPKIMQGPIIRYNEIKETLFGENDFNYEGFTNGLKRMLWGYFKKMVIADCLIVFTKYAFENPQLLSSIEAALAIICYFIYDYCDFSGYMDIACGVSECLGVKLPENFNHPYFACGIDEYWRRWHMTLGAWFKDYIFYPLSVSKFSLNLGKKSKKIFKKNANKVPAIFGLILVWFLTGLWHGASWNYVLWGLYFGLIIIISIILEPLFNRFYEKTKIDRNAKWIVVLRHLRTLVLLAFGKILFETNSLGATFAFIGSLFNFGNEFPFMQIHSSIGAPSLITAMILSLIVLVVDLIQEKNPETTFRQKLKKLPLALEWALLLCLVIFIVWFGYYGQGLPKYEFGYMGF